MDTVVQTLLQHPRVRVRVTPNARKTMITKTVDDTIYLDVAAPPENDKANTAVERYLTKLSGKTATVVQGATTKTKMIKLT